MGAVRVLLRRAQQLSVPVHLLCWRGVRVETAPGVESEKLVQNRSYAESAKGSVRG